MTTDQFSVDGRRTVVTAASSGIGRAMPSRSRPTAPRVAICSRSAENVEPVAAAICEERGEPIAVECDVRNREAPDAFVAETVEGLGGMDALVNNAGGGRRSWQASRRSARTAGPPLLTATLTGTNHCPQAAAEPLRDGGGSVVNLAGPAYEWSGPGVRVNRVAPGFVTTPGLASQKGIGVDELDRENVDRRVSLSGEIADVVQFLASTASSFVNGEM